MNKVIKAALTPLVAAGMFGTAHAATEADVESTFSPYKNGFPTFPGLKPGMVINKSNVDQFKDILPLGTYKIVKEGWTELPVVASSNFELSRAYIDATRQNLNKAKLGPKNGDIEGYVAGRPFPEEPRLDDPRAGEKRPGTTSTG